MFFKYNVMYLLVEVESDHMSSHKSTKNGRKGAHGFNWISLTNFGHSTWLVPIYT